MIMHVGSRLAGVVALSFGLSACIDMTMDIEVLSDTTAKATVTSTMGPDIYPMVKAGAASEGATEDGFCKEKGAVLTETPEGGATCVQVSEGPFADLDMDNGGDAAFTVVSPGVVRVAFKTEDMKGDLASSTGGEGAEADAETKAMMAAFFEGKELIIRIRGKQVLETNMDLSADKTTAEKIIPFLDLINGTVDLPDELFAVVKTN